MCNFVYTPTLISCCELGHTSMHCYRHISRNLAAVICIISDVDCDSTHSQVHMYSTLNYSHSHVMKEQVMMFCVAITLPCTWK